MNLSYVGSMLPNQSLDSCLDLFDAIANDHDLCLERFHKKGHSLSIKNSSFQNPIHYACEKNAVKCLLMLLHFGAKPNKRDKNGKFPLWYAVTFKNSECVNILLKYGASPKKKYNEKSPKKKYNEKSLLHCVRDEDSLKYLIDSGKDINGENFVSYYVISQNLESLEIFLKAGAKSNIESIYDSGYLTPLKYAVSKKQFDMINILLKYSPKDIYEDRRIFMEIINSDEYIDILGVFFENGFDINTECKMTKETILYSTVYINKINVDAIKFLLENGANINIKNKDGIPLLHYYIERNKIDIVKILLEYGADVNIKGKNGCNSLQCAISSMDMVKLLLEYGADKNAKNDSGSIPTDYCIYSHQKKNKRIYRKLPTSIRTL